MEDISDSTSRPRFWSREVDGERQRAIWACCLCFSSEEERRTSGPPASKTRRSARSLVRTVVPSERTLDNGRSVSVPERAQSRTQAR